MLENTTLQVPGDTYVDPRQFTVTGVRIELDLPGHRLAHTLALKPGEDIAGVFFTLGANLPDLPPDAIDTLQKSADGVRQAVAKPTVHAALAWYTRGIVYRFLAAQTRYEDELARQLDLTAGRTDLARALLVTVRRAADPSRLQTSVDLMQSANQLHHGDEQARHAFNILSGVFASRLEGAVLPGNKADFIDVWQRSPDGTKLFLSLPSRRADDLKYMQDHGFPARLIQYAKASKNALLVPNQPTRIYGQTRWEWLEIDPATYQTIAVADNGEHGSFADYLMAMEPIAPSGDDYLSFMVGGFVGIDTSVWSISAFSLQSSDYNAVYRAAKAYTYAIAEVLSGIGGIKDMAKLEFGIGSIKLSLGDANFDNLEALFESVQHGAVKGDFVGFGQGFGAGAAYYFKHAAPKAPPKAPPPKPAPTP